MKNQTNNYNLISISHYFYPRVGGLENMAYGVIKNLSQRGFKSIAIFGNDRNLKFETEGFTWKSFNCFKIFNKAYPLLGIRFFSFILKTLKNSPNAVVLIYDRHLSSSFLGALACTLLNRKYVLVSQTTTSNYFNNKFLSFLSEVFEAVFSKYVVLNANKIVCVSGANKEYVIKHFKVNPKKTVIIYNFFKDETISRFLNTEKQNVVVFNTKFIPVKDPNTTALAFLSIAEKYPEWKFFFAGEGSTILNDMQDLPENLEFRPKFIPQLELFGMLSESAIYVNSSLNEGLSLGVIEAAALGNITVLSDAPSNIEVSQKLGTEDLVFKRQSPAELANKIENAIELFEKKGKILSSKLSDNAFKYFSSEAVLEEYFNILNTNTSEILYFGLNKAR